jgi:hypothetical protein
MSTWVLLLVVALVALGPVIICLRHPLTVTLPAFAALVPFGGLISVTSAPAEGSNMWARFGSLSSLLGVLLAIGLLLQLVAGRRVSVRMSATVPLWLLFLGAAAATSLWSLDPVKTGNGLLSLGSLSIVYIFLALSEINRQVVHRVEQGLVFGGVAVSCYGLFQLAVLGGFPNDVAGIPSDGGGRFGNDMLGPNNEAVALLLPLMICLHRSVTRKEAQTRHFNMFLCALMFLGIVMTGSRGGIIAASVSLIALIVYSSKGRQKLATYLAIGLIAGGVAFFMHPFGRFCRLPPVLPVRLGLGDLPERVREDAAEGPRCGGAGRQGRLLPAAQRHHAGGHRARPPRPDPVVHRARYHVVRGTSNPPRSQGPTAGGAHRHLHGIPVPVEPGVQVLLDGVVHGGALSEHELLGGPDRGDDDSEASRAEARRTQTGTKVQTACGRRPLRWVTTQVSP